MNPVGLNVRSSRYDLAYTHSSRAHFFFFFWEQTKKKKSEDINATVNTQINLCELSCKIKVEWFGVHYSHAAAHSAARKAVKRWLFVDAS